MKQRLTGLSKRYLAALRTYLKQGPGATLSDSTLGREALALGLDTLELARIHERALAALKLSNGKNALTKRAGIFFAKTNKAIEDTHRGDRQGKAGLIQIEERLAARTEELAVSNCQLQRGVVQRKIMEKAADKRGKQHQKNLEESLKLQQRLRQLTHRVIAAQENDRKKISHELQDEIAQTLLGINVRLLALKRQARGNTESFRSEIASTQRLVAKSARSVRQVAREIAQQE